MNQRFILYIIVASFGYLSLAAAQQPATQVGLPYSPSLDVTSLDKSVNPCEDFYQYSCGGWQKKNPIPPDQISWSVFGKLYQNNLIFLRIILEEAAAGKGLQDSVTQKVGGFYAACMDEAEIEKRGVRALKPELDAIAELKSVRDLAPVIAELHSKGTGSILFEGTSQQDPDNPEQQIASLDQGGMGLPDRDYYTKDDVRWKEIRERYSQHVQHIFELLGDSLEAAKTNASTVMRIETALANASMASVEYRDRYKHKNKIKLEDLDQLAPNFNWQAYFHELKTPPFEIINVVPPSFFKEVNAELAVEPLAHWKNYLRYHVADEFSPYLSSAFVQEDFEFYLKYLRGTREMPPRWKRCVQFTDRNLGEALGQVYVSKTFSPTLKQNTLEMAHRIEAAMEQRISQLDWMSAEAKEQALVKLHAVRNKIGYPEKWRDYSTVRIVRGDFLGNVERTTEFEHHRTVNKIGQPVDRSEWSITPPTVNAYYDDQMNDISFPAGILQPPFYDARMDDAPNYGNAGGLIGHELTHGFDDEGSRFDAQGNLREWWSITDRQKFEERTNCVQDQYAQFVAVDDLHVNSKLTLAEDLADLGGEILAYIAWRNVTQDKSLHSVDGLTPEQRFFIGFAQRDCHNERPASMRLLALTDPHSPGRYRVNGVVMNMPEFAQAFSCKAGQPMTKSPSKICKVW